DALPILIGLTATECDPSKKISALQAFDDRPNLPFCRSEHVTTIIFCSEDALGLLAERPPPNFLAGNPYRPSAFADLAIDCRNHRQFVIRHPSVVSDLKKTVPADSYLSVRAMSVFKL